MVPYGGKTTSHTFFYFANFYGFFLKILCGAVFRSQNFQYLELLSHSQRMPWGRRCRWTAARRRASGRWGGAARSRASQAGQRTSRQGCHSSHRLFLPSWPRAPWGPLGLARPPQRPVFFFFFCFLLLLFGKPEFKVFYLEFRPIQSCQGLLRFVRPPLPHQEYGGLGDEQTALKNKKTQNCKKKPVKSVWGIFLKSKAHYFFLPGYRGPKFCIPTKLIII